MCGVALLGASRFCDYGFVAVSLFRDLACFEVVATRTVTTFTALFGASGCFCLRPCAHVVTESGNGILSYQYFSAFRALFAFCQTGFGTGRLYRLECDSFPTAVVVRKCCNRSCFKCIAVLTIAAFFALLRLGGSFGFIPLAEAVTCCADVCVNVAVAAG